MEHGHEGLQVVRHDAFQEGLADFDVVAAPFDADDGRADVGLEDLAFFVDFHDAGHGVTVFIGVEAADAVGQDRRQHGDDPVDKVDAGAAVICFLVDGRSRADVVADVGDVDAQSEMAVGQADDVDGIVQVLGIFTVDGDELAVAVIAAPFFQGDRRVDLGGFLLDVVREVERQAVAGHDDLDIQVLVAVIAEDFRHFPFGFAPFFGPLGDLDQDAGTAAGAAGLVEGHVDVFADAFVVRRDEGAVFFQLERTDQGLVDPFDDGYDFPFLFMTAIAAVQDADRDLIVIHGRMAVLFGNVYVLRQVLAEDEPEGRRITFINTGDFLGLFGRDIPVSCDSHELFTPH